MLNFERPIAHQSSITFFLYTLYKWADGADHDFVLPRHGNASEPASGSYFRKDPSFFQKWTICLIEDYLQTKSTAAYPSSKTQQ